MLVYFVSLLVAISRLSLLAFIASIGIAGYLFSTGRALQTSPEKADQPLSDLTDRVRGDMLVKRSLLVFFIATPLLFLCFQIIPNRETLLNQMGYNNCMNGQSGVLVGGVSNSDIATLTFRMDDGVSIVCQVSRINAKGLSKGARYQMTRGSRVS